MVFQGHMSNCKVTRLKKSSILTKIKRFRTVTPVWIHQWLRNDAKSFKWHRRGALLSSVKFQGYIAKKNRRIWPIWGVSGLYLQFEFTNGYEMMHKAWSSIEGVPYRFSRWYVKLQGHSAKKVVDFDSNRAFPDCDSSLNSPMATKWCTKLEVA